MEQVQQPDGFWVPGNQFLAMRQWSPEVANQSTTMWAAIALAEYGGSTQSQNVAVQKSIAWQHAQPSIADNYEWLATRLLWEKHFGSPLELQPLRQHLMTAQNADGGWGWQKSAANDPYTTGLITYVLANVCAVESAAEIQSARSFLLASQQPDGSRHTSSKNISNTSDPERLKARDEIYHYWGTAWATLGLLESLEARTGSE